jgi:beta-lactamase class D
MKIEICKSMKVAQKVLKEVEKMLAQVKKDDPISHGETGIYLQAYQNGREQGYALLSLGRWVAWAENRNSDHIVVYVSDLDPMQSISDTIYQNRQMFQYNEIKKVARFITNQFAPV